MRLIDADEFIEYCRKGLKDMSAVPYYKDSIKAMIEATKGFIDDIEEQPTIDAAPVVHAHWIYRGYTFPDGQYRKCSACKGLIKVVANDGKFCGHCGAKMEE